MSIIEITRHELRIGYGLTLFRPSLCGWEVFPMLGALAHTRITWALSPTAQEVLGVTPGSPLCPWCSGHSSWRGARQLVYVVQTSRSYSDGRHAYGRELLCVDSATRVVFGICFNSLPLNNYLVSGEKKRKWEVRVISRHFVVMRNELFMRGAEVLLCRGVGANKAPTILAVCHDSPCGGQFTRQRILWAG